jgi:hypothetical protein
LNEDFHDGHVEEQEKSEGELPEEQEKSEGDIPEDQEKEGEMNEQGNSTVTE